MTSDMYARPQMSRSASASTAGPRRPKSRQSTISEQSTGNQNGAPNDGMAAAYERTAPPLFRVQAQPQSAAFQGIPEELIAQNSEQLRNRSNSISYHQTHGANMIDPALHQHNLPQQHGMQYIAPGSLPHEHYASRHQSIEPNYAQYNRAGSFAHDLGEQDETFDDGSRRKKGSATSQANDNELRKLFQENQGRTLSDLARQVSERRSEKDKQIFGMFWLSTYCKKSSGSVPRSRVFAHYATRCGNERTPPLNAASFGKLVRIIFPGITTRRLGVRGESKYHYVELNLNAENDNEPLNRPANDGEHAGELLQNGTSGRGNASRRTQPPADTAIFPSPDSPPRILPQALAPIQEPTAPSTTSARIFMPQGVNMMREKNMPTFNRVLQFPTSASSSSRFNGPFQLPSIEPYLPPGADPDAVDTLTSVYRSHCLITIDAFRFCKSNEFFESYKSLMGLLTSRPLKLLAEPSIAPWIKQCNWLRYQRMMPVLEGTILSQVPPKVMNHMDTICSKLCVNIAEIFQHQPPHLREALMGPATLFATLIQRMMRVHRSAIDLASIVEDKTIRNELWSDWVAYVDPLYVLSATLYDEGVFRVLDILTQEAREILQPPNGHTMIYTNLMFQPPAPRNSSSSTDSLDNNGSFVDRLTHFLTILPTRFPQVSARDLLKYIDHIGNNVSRNLTLGGAASLGTWWRIHVFIGEMANWLAEKGGFLESGDENLVVKGHVRRSIAAHFGSDDNAAFNLDIPNDDVESRPRTAASAGTLVGNGELANGLRYDHDVAADSHSHPPPSSTFYPSATSNNLNLDPALATGSTLPPRHGANPNPRKRPADPSLPEAAHPPAKRQQHLQPPPIFSTPHRHGHNTRSSPFRAAHQRNISAPSGFTPSKFTPSKFMTAMPVEHDDSGIGLGLDEDWMGGGEEVAKDG